jgi:hypothetical protein
MRFAKFALAAWLVVPSFGRAQQRERSPSRPIPYSRSSTVSHGHPAESDRGTAPCGTRTSKACPPSLDTPRHEENHTGRNVAIGVGVGVLAGASIAMLAHNADPANKLSANGPQFPDIVHMSTFQVTGFVEGGWPLVIDYEAQPGTYAVLTIVTQGAQPYSVQLPVSVDGGRRIEIMELPVAVLGRERKIGEFTVRATGGPYDDRLRYLRIYGFGCGKKAVGSVAIDQLHFSPQAISASQSKAQISFHVHTDFNKSNAEFMQVALVDDCLEGKIFDDMSIKKHLFEGDHFGDTWNGKKAHQGQIQFRVRGWMTGENGGDWVSAFSPDLVLMQ